MRSALLRVTFFLLLPLPSFAQHYGSGHARTTFAINIILSYLLAAIIVGTSVWMMIRRKKSRLYSH